jgi:HlyD family secretion protein
VYRVIDGKAVETRVTTGIQDQSYLQILSGLQEGDVVVSAPYNTISRELKNNDPVKIVPKSSLYGK